MANFSLTRADWSVGGNVTVSEMQALEAKAYAGINIYGGTWAPSAVINLGVGSGESLFVTGPVFIGYGGTLTISNVGAPTVRTLTLSGFPVLGANHPGITRDVVVPFSKSFLDSSVSSDHLSVDTANPMGALPLWGLVNDIRPTLVLPIRGHNASKLSGVTIRYKVASDQNPTTMPRARILSVDENGVRTEISDGWVSLPSVLGPVWKSGGVVQEFSVPVVSTTPIDISTKHYLIELNPEVTSGTIVYTIEVDRAPSEDVNISAVTLSNGAPMPTYSAFSPPLVDGDVLLLWNQTVQSQNGLYEYRSGALGAMPYPSKTTYAFDLALSQWYQGVPGLTNVEPVAWRPFTAPSATIYMATWLSATCHFTSIADARFP